MREIKINDSMEIHYETKLEDHGFSHGLGYTPRIQAEVESFEVVVKTKRGDWVNITHAIPESFYVWCAHQAERDLMEKMEVA